MSENQLQVIVQESGLEATKAAVIMEQFGDYFAIAAEWEVKAKAIVVTDASQKEEMELARKGRLFLRDKRIAIEKNRKAIKEQTLREGKAIDGIANVLKALIVPIEEHLAAQENFVELLAQEAANKERIRLEQKAEQKRIAEQKHQQEEQEKLRKENERLRKKTETAKAKERKAREEAEIATTKERAKLQRENERLQKKAADIKAKERKLRQEAAIEGDRIREENERLNKKTRELKKTIECPKCHHKFVPKEAK